MAGKSRIYFQAGIYVLLMIIMVIAIGIARDCTRLKIEHHDGRSAGDTLDIAMLFVPGSLYMYSDTLAGINKSIAEEFEKDLNLPIKIWPITEPAYGMEKLESKDFDILASLPLDNYIKNRFDVSESVFLDRLVLVQTTDSAGIKQITSSLDLNGKDIHVIAGSSAIKRLQNLAQEIGGTINIIEEKDLSEELLTLKVANGSIPFAVVNERVAREIADSYPNLTYDTTISFTQFQVWVFNKTDSIIFKQFNDWFENFRQTEKYRKILDSYRAREKFTAIP